MTRNPMFLKYKFFVKFLICAYWVKKINSSHNLILRVGYNIYYFLGFQNRCIFFKTLFARTLAYFDQNPLFWLFFFFFFNDKYRIRTARYQNYYLILFKLN